MFREVVQDMPNVTVGLYRGLTVDYAAEIGAAGIIRGVRSLTDVDYEAAMVMMNRKLQPGIDTILLYTSLEYQFVSSTLIKEVARYGGDITDLVPQNVAIALRSRFKDGT